MGIKSARKGRKYFNEAQNLLVNKLYSTYENSQCLFPFIQYIYISSMLNGQLNWTIIIIMIMFNILFLNLFSHYINMFIYIYIYIYFSNVYVYILHMFP